MSAFDPVAAKALVEEVLDEESLAQRKRELRAIASYPRLTRRQEEAIQAERNLQSVAEGFSHDVVVGCDGVLHGGPRIQETQMVLAERARLRKELERDDVAPDQRARDFKAFNATYGR